MFTLIWGERVVRRKPPDGETTAVSRLEAAMLAVLGGNGERGGCRDCSDSF